MYVDTVNTNMYTLLSITLLIFNRCSIQKKFWTAENQAFQPHQICMHVNTMKTGIRFILHSMLWMSTLSI